MHKPGSDEPAGLYRLGDQMAVTPSFSGDGMSIALHTAFAAVETHLAGEDALAYHSAHAPGNRTADLATPG